MDKVMELFGRESVPTPSSLHNDWYLIWLRHLVWFVGITLKGEEVYDIFNNLCQPDFVDMPCK